MMKNLGMMKKFSYGKDKKILSFLVLLVQERHTMYLNLQLDYVTQALMLMVQIEKIVLKDTINLRKKIVLLLRHSISRWITRIG